jgi:hypothetical protein
MKEAYKRFIFNEKQERAVQQHQSHTWTAHAD